MRVTLFLIVFIISINFSKGQDSIGKFKSKIYQRIGFGYSFTSGYGLNSQIVENYNGHNLYSLVPYSYGKGLNLNYGLGYMFHPNIGAELGASYLFGGKSEINNSKYYMNGSTLIPDQETIKTYSRVFRLNPSLILSVNYKKISPYAKLGVLFVWGSTYSDIYDNVSSGPQDDVKWKISGIYGFGYTSSAGVRFKNKSGLLDFFIELSQISLGATPKKGKMISSTIDGQSNLNSLSTANKEEIFVNNTPLFPSDANQPTPLLKQKFSFDSVGLNLGIIIKFSKKY